MNDSLANLLSLLEAALHRLDNALAQPPNEYVRDSAIQRFEFTFELLWKSLKAFSADAGVRVFSPKESLRSAFQLGVIAEEPLWLQMLEDRNLTSHTYNLATAEAIYSHLRDYARLIHAALAELKKRQ
jgi:nucleotidyltransferase substrate binding protein (TIGR01987 family)